VVGCRIFTHSEDSADRRHRCRKRCCVRRPTSRAWRKILAISLPCYGTLVSDYIHPFHRSCRCFHSSLSSGPYLHLASRRFAPFVTFDNQDTAFRDQLSISALSIVFSQSLIHKTHNLKIKSNIPHYVLQLRCRTFQSRRYLHWISFQTFNSDGPQFPFSIVVEAFLCESFVTIR